MAGKHSIYNFATALFIKLLLISTQLTSHVLDATAVSLSQSLLLKETSTGHCKFYEHQADVHTKDCDSMQLQSNFTTRYFLFLIFFSRFLLRPPRRSAGTVRFTTIKTLETQLLLA